MRKMWLVVAGLLIVAPIAAACGGAPSPAHTVSPTSMPTTASPHATSTAGGTSALRTATVNGITVLTNGEGHTVYTFALDTSHTSKCSGACAAAWPPVHGPALAGSGVTAGQLATLKRSNGELQATYHGHPLYTFSGDTSAHEATGNGVSAFGGLWHAAAPSGAVMPGAPGHAPTHTATPTHSPMPTQTPTQTPTHTPMPTSTSTTGPGGY